MIQKLKIKKVAIIALVVFGLSSVTSCKKFLDENPSTQFTSDFVYNTPAGLQLGIVALYSLNRGFYENGEWLGAVPNMLNSKDDLVYSRTGEISLFSVIVWGGSLNDFGTTRYGHWWNTYYRIVDRANALIIAAEEMQGIDEAARKKAIAEAKFFRANSFFMLFKLFKNIYITTTPTTPENAFNKVDAPSTEAAIYTQIYADLDYAIANLPATIPAADYGRLSQLAARHVKAEAALTKGDYAEAKLQAETVIAARPALTSVTTANVFAGELNTSENIFSIQFRNNALVPVGGGASNFFSTLCIPQYGSAPGGIYEAAQGGRGFGWLMLNNYFRSLLIDPARGGDPNDRRANNTYYQFKFFYNSTVGLPPGKNLGDLMTTYNEFAPGTTGAGPTERGNFLRTLNPGCKKYLDETALPATGTHFKNIMVYRLGETYLLAAEANYRLADYGTASTQLNAVRTRAGVANLTLTAANAKQAIIDENARELAFESKRWFLLKRFGELTNYMVNHAGYGQLGSLDLPGTAAGNSHAGTYADPYPAQNHARSRWLPRMEIWPIPPAEKALLGPNYPQAPGY